MRSLFLIFFFCYVTGKAQDRACVVSEKDSIPLSNVYICLKDRRVIAISDEKGVFSTFVFTTDYYSIFYR